MSKRKKILEKDTSNFNLIDLIFLIAPLFYGLLPIWSLCLLGVTCLGIILYKVHQNEKLILPKGPSIYLILVYLLSFLVTEFVAVDKGMNILAFIKNIPIILFIILVCQFNEDFERKMKHFYYVSISSASSVLISLLLIAFPDSGIYMSSRLQGLFFYANSYGLFLLVGLISLVFKKNKKWYDYIMVAILILGIVLTNSRAIIILTAIFIIASIFFNKDQWKSTSIILVAFILSFLAFYFLFNAEKRVSTDMVTSSEFISRIIYYEDAMSLIKSHPLGLGYEGFWYEQAKSQTAIYDTRYVHSSVFQIVLDVGIIPLICLGVMLILTFFDKEQTAFSRIILILIVGHSLIDIDFEYIYFIMIISLFIKYETFTINQSKIIDAISCTLGIVFLWVFLGDVNNQVKNYSFTAKELPIHTDNLQDYLYSTTSKEEQLEYAHKILKLNDHVSGAYEALRNEAKEKKDYLDALKYEKLRLELNKYKMVNYVSYANLLVEAYNNYANNNDIKNLEYCVNELVGIEKKINQVLEDTNPLCYKTIHTPELELPKELKALIDSVS